MNLTVFKPLITLFFSAFFAFLFYDKLLGLNLVIFESVAFTCALFIHKPKLKSATIKLLLGGTLISLIMVLLHNSSISKLVNIISFFCLMGGIVFSDYKLISNYLLQFLTSIKLGIFNFFENLFPKKTKRNRFFRYIKIIVIPILIIFVFLAIYYNSNAYFAQLVDSFGNMIYSFFEWIPAINLLLILYLFLGLMMAIQIFYGKKDEKIIVAEKNLTDHLIRKRKKIRRKKKMGLKDEYKSGIFLLIVLNLMLLVFNYSDITKIWFSYEWDGRFLREFVHQATILLIVSLFFSIGIVLYYFKGNLNFYSKNKPLKILTFFWLGQNLILIISLAIRNSIYVENFALAYKRIGVYAFLIAATIGIITIFIKVVKIKTFHYLIKNNSIVVYCIFILLTCSNWDVVISKYNVDSSKTSFIELEYLLELSDKALPYIDLDNEVLNQISTTQKSLLSSSRTYMNNVTYKEFLEKKKENFIESYSDRNLLEWNYADYKAYHLLIHP